MNAFATVLLVILLAFVAFVFIVALWAIFGGVDKVIKKDLHRS